MISRQIDSVELRHLNGSDQTWSALWDECTRLLAGLAHEQVVAGWTELGLRRDRIPNVDELNRKLARWEWRVVPVTGFIPPREYLGHLANKCLPIATNMRAAPNLQFNPEPDLFHEAFGHLCMLANPHYRTFLRDWGLASVKAFQQPGEAAFYRQVRQLAEDLSIPGRVANSPVFTETLNSEAAKLARLGWWTVECGLIRTSDRFEVYGAAVLSSAQEVRNMLSSEAKVEASEITLNLPFDPTRVQEQYVYINCFSQLSELLSRLTATMAFSRGGVFGLEVAIGSGERAICRFKSGRLLRGKILGFETTKSNLIIRSLVAQSSGLEEIRSEKIPVDDLLLSVFPEESERYI